MKSFGEPVLTKIGELDFNFANGACANVDNQLVYLCFESEGQKLCRVASQPEESFTEIQESASLHTGIQIAASKC